MTQATGAEHGMTNREIFASPGWHWEKLEKMFTQRWLSLGHESQTPKPRDLVVSRSQWEPPLGHDGQTVQEAAE